MAMDILTRWKEHNWHKRKKEKKGHSDLFTLLAQEEEKKGEKSSLSLIDILTDMAKLIENRKWRFQTLTTVIRISNQMIPSHHWTPVVRYCFLFHYLKDVFTKQHKWQVVVILGCVNEVDWLLFSVLPEKAMVVTFAFNGAGKCMK